MIPIFILWKWKSATYRTSYSADHVNLMVWMLTKHGVPLENIVLVTDDPSGVVCRTFPIWSDHNELPNISGAHLPSCYRRLKIFHRGTQEQMGIPAGVRIVSLDLDGVIIQKWLELFDRKEQFVGWKVPGTRHRVVMNGSMFMFTAGEMEWLWDDFHPQRSPSAAISAGYMGSDQGYLSHKLVHQPFVGGWFAQKDGVLSYQRDVIRMRLLPKYTRVVFFPGKAKPWDIQTRKISTWILRYVPQPGDIAA